ncbi:hypothetical protein WJX72_011580 [[Myrmecia] bisecta]|uniref:BAH domain-containing protein n=1 Tax=[Myrmecia] bisecta TaxID=41462 RepID=A0AAW1QT06_9CHLO
MRPWIVQATELFEDYAGNRWMKCDWYWRPHETCLLVNVDTNTRRIPADLHAKRLFKAAKGSFDTDVSLYSAERVVTVEKRQPGTGPPEEDCYWYESGYDQKFASFEDCSDEPPASKAKWAGAR